MQYWWVSQGHTWREEHKGGFMWAPKVNKDGSRFFHWDNLAKVRSGDIVFSYYNKSLRSVGVAISDGYDGPRPIDFPAIWEVDGWRVDVAWNQLAQPINASTFLADLLQTFNRQRYQPVYAKGVNQFYLCGLEEASAVYLMNLTGWEAGLLDKVLDGDGGLAAGRYKTAQVKVRIGQAHFRQLLRDYWQDQCAVTGARAVEVLRASHTIGWAESSEADRVNVFNGLLLSPAYDAVFDAHLASFDDDA